MIKKKKTLPPDLTDAPEQSHLLSQFILHVFAIKIFSNEHVGSVFPKNKEIHHSMRIDTGQAKAGIENE